MNKKMRTIIRTKYRLSDLRSKFGMLVHILIRTKSVNGSVTRFYLIKNSRTKKFETFVFKTRFDSYSLKFVVNEDGGFGIFSLCWFEPMVFKYITSQRGRIFIDVGANEGGYTLHSYLHFEKVISVEPGEKARNILLLNISLNGAYNVEVVPCAVTNKIGNVRLYSHKGLVNHSLVNISDNYIEVSAISLYELLQPFDSVDLIKIDVEGAELDVINSGLELIDRVRQLVIEVRNMHEKEIIHLLLAKGFRCYILEDRRDIGEKNLLFINAVNGNNKAAFFGNIFNECIA